MTKPTQCRLWSLRLSRLSGAAAGLSLVIAATANATADEAVALHGRTMGTTYNIKYCPAPGAPNPPSIQRDVDALLARFDVQMSTWREDSELSRFNAAPAGAWFPVSADVAAVVSRALELHRMTAGASDVTVGPAVALWGFGASSPATVELRHTPSDPEIQAALARVGAQHLQVRADPPALRKDVDGLEVDLSSIAPGYAVDLIVAQLADATIDNALVELGGEVRAVGTRPDGTPWRVGIQSPPPREATIATVVPLTNHALATSGDFHHVRIVDGQKLTHIFDPHTGRPLPYRGASVTVVAPTCFEADGLATALFVMGDEVGFQWCVEHETAALFQGPDAEGKFSPRATPRFLDVVKSIGQGTTAE